MTRTVTPTREVKTRNILCWGMGDIFGSGAMTITGLWLLYFYIEVAGLSPAAGQRRPRTKLRTERIDGS